MHDIVAIKFDTNNNIISTYSSLNEILQSAKKPSLDFLSINNIYIVINNEFTILKNKISLIKLNQIINYEYDHDCIILENNTCNLKIQSKHFENLKNIFTNLIIDKEQYLKDIANVIAYKDLDNQINNILLYRETISSKKSELLSSIQSVTDISSLLNIDMGFPNFNLV